MSPFRAAAALLLFAGCKDWRTGVQAGLAVEAPAQAAVEPFELQAPPGARGKVTARARYSIKAWVVAVDEPRDDFQALMPIDLSLVWGPVADPKALSTMKFHLANRYISARWSGKVQLDSRFVMRHLSNHHFVPASAKALEELRVARPGDFIELKGYLVDVINEKGQTQRSSLSRDDVGNGACEIVWVEGVTVSRPAR